MALREVERNTRTSNQDGGLQNTIWITYVDDQDNEKECTLLDWHLLQAETPKNQEDQERVERLKAHNDLSSKTTIPEEALEEIPVSEESNES